MSRPCRLNSILAVSLLVNLLFVVWSARWLLQWRKGNEELEQALVYLPALSEINDVATLRLAVPKHLRNLKVKTFAELSRKCQLSNRVLDCPEVHLSGETLVRQSQLVLVRMLKVFDIIAQKHGIEYFLLFGTLLGAYRSGVTLSHDHDIDVGMLLHDYAKMESIIRNELPSEFFFQDGSDEPDFPKKRAAKAKLRSNKSCYANCLHCNFNDGLQIDFFVFKAYKHGQVIDTELGSHVYPMSAIQPIQTITYEGLSFPAPSNVPLVLEITYGKNFRIPDVSFPTEEHVPSPWYSCDYIRTSKNRDKIMKELYIR